MLTLGNVDDRKPVPKLARKLFGKLLGDKGFSLKRFVTNSYTPLVWNW